MKHLILESLQQKLKNPVLDEIRKLSMSIQAIYCNLQIYASLC